MPPTKDSASAGIEESGRFTPRFGPDGLSPCVTIEASSGDVLMFAWMNEEALRRTLETGLVHYWSRSRNSLWQKGETSGHIQEIVEIRVDCDGDSVLYRVRQTGPACHTLQPTCFHRAVEDEGLAVTNAAAHVLGLACTSFVTNCTTARIPLAASSSAASRGSRTWSRTRASPCAISAAPPCRR